jgi:hypothetical protein
MKYAKRVQLGRIGWALDTLILSTPLRWMRAARWLLLMGGLGLYLAGYRMEPLTVAILLVAVEINIFRLLLVAILRKMEEK